MPSPLGAWLLPDGSVLAGYRQDEPPASSSEWRGYYDCTYRILSLYASNVTGREKLAQRLNDEGWQFKDRWGQPRPLQEDDIRRVICNWAEYGGMVRDRRAKDVPLYDIDVATSRFVPERAVFPIELLRQVVTIAQARSFRQNRRGKAPHYEAPPLTGLCYCAHCEAAANSEQGRHYRPRLGTVHLPKQTSYRHRSNVTCSTISHSVPAADLEHEVGRLIDLLVIDRAALDAFLQIEYAAQPPSETVQPKALAACQERIERLKQLYLALEIDETQYQTRMARYRQELEHLTAAFVSPTDLQVQLDYCAAKLVMLQEAWCSGTGLERRTTLHGIFEEIVIDLDTRRITAFRLKAWATDYLKACPSQLSEQGATHYGHAADPDQALLRVLYHGAMPVVAPFNRAAKQARNHSLCERYSAGETLEELSRAYGITPQRVHQVVRGHRK